MVLSNVITEIVEAVTSPTLSQSLPLNAMGCLMNKKVSCPN